MSLRAHRGPLSPARRAGPGAGRVPPAGAWRSSRSGAARSRAVPRRRRLRQRILRAGGEAARGSRLRHRRRPEMLAALAGSVDRRAAARHRAARVHRPPSIGSCAPACSTSWSIPTSLSRTFCDLVRATGGWSSSPRAKVPAGRSTVPRSGCSVRGQPVHPRVVGGAGGEPWAARRAGAQAVAVEHRDRGRPALTARSLHRREPHPARHAAVQSPGTRDGCSRSRRQGRTAAIAMFHGNGLRTRTTRSPWLAARSANHAWVNR